MVSKFLLTNGESSQGILYEGILKSQRMILTDIAVGYIQTLPFQNLHPHKTSKNPKRRWLLKDSDASFSGGMLVSGFLVDTRCAPCNHRFFYGVTGILIHKLPGKSHGFSSPTWLHPRCPAKQSTTPPPVSPARGFHRERRGGPWHSFSGKQKNKSPNDCKLKDKDGGFSFLMMITSFET